MCCAVLCCCFGCRSDRILTLARFVCSVLGGVPRGNGSAASALVSASAPGMESIDSTPAATATATAVTALKPGGAGRHRSLLFKYLCDQFGIDCRLVRSTTPNPLDFSPSVNAAANDFVWCAVYQRAQTQLVDLSSPELVFSVPNHSAR